MRFNLVVLCAVFVGLAAADCGVPEVAPKGWDCSQVSDLHTWAENTLETAISNLSAFDGAIPQWNRDYNVVLLQQAKTAFFMVETDIRHRNPDLDFVECDLVQDRRACDAGRLSDLIEEITNLDDQLDAAWSNGANSCYAEQEVVSALGKLRCALDATISCLNGYNAICGDAQVPAGPADNGCAAPQVEEPEVSEQDSSSEEEVSEPEAEEETSEEEEIPEPEVEEQSESEPEIPKVIPKPEAQCGCERGCSSWDIPKPRRSACPCCPEPKPEPIPIVPVCPERQCIPWDKTPEGCPGSCGVWGAHQKEEKIPNIPVAKPPVVAQPECRTGGCSTCGWGPMIRTGWEDGFGKKHHEEAKKPVKQVKQQAEDDGSDLDE